MTWWPSCNSGMRMTRGDLWRMTEPALCNESSEQFPWLQADKGRHMVRSVSVSLNLNHRSGFSPVQVPFCSSQTCYAHCSRAPPHSSQMTLRPPWLTPGRAKQYCRLPPWLLPQSGSSHLRKPRPFIISIKQS